MNYSDKMLKYIVRKWYVVLLCAVLGAGILYVEKGSVAPPAVVNGNLLYSRVVKFEPVPYVSYGNTTQEAELAELLNSWRSMYTTYTELEEKLDIEKICAGWKRLPMIDRANWMEKHLQVVSAGPGAYELEIQLSDTDAKDTAYVEENHLKIMDAFTESVRKTSAPVVGGSELKVVEDFRLVDMHHEAAQAGVQKKYVIIGFVLGALAGMAVLAVFSLRKKEDE
ncbi:MAG: hypothetical protein J6N51_07045 [Selenomonas sp.]|nr:hypothetical protein [Selenomonas sp.]